MPITRFLQGQIFDLEHVRAMSDAFSDACNTLGLADRDDALTALVAGHIIKLARQGVRSKTALYLSTVLDDFSRYILAWKLCTTMAATDVSDTLQAALQASGLDRVKVLHWLRLTPAYAGS